MSEPTAQELRTAARVLRHAVSESRKASKHLPFFGRVWLSIFGDDGDEMLRKSAVLESMADREEIPND